jgi:hypothetical protein
MDHINKNITVIISPHKTEAQLTLGTSASNIVATLNTNNIKRIQSSLYAP